MTQISSEKQVADRLLASRPASDKTFRQDVLDAARTFRARRDRREDPQGSFDRARRWTPDASERHSCCFGLYTPSRAHPFSLLAHCRTARHCAIGAGVDEAEVRAAARLMDRGVIPQVKEAQEVRS